MPKSKYENIYSDLKQKIIDKDYKYQELIPSENILIQEYSCSRNTLRRAIKKLADEGYVQSLRGKGVRIIYEKPQQSDFVLDGIESFSEATLRNSINQYTNVIHFEETIVNQDLHQKTGFHVGKNIYYIQRIRFIDGIPLIIDHNYFLKDVVTFLSKDIARFSIYSYLEKQLNIKITTTKRIITVEPVTRTDLNNLSLDGCNCVAVISNSTYNDDGIMFEYTQSRHSPKHFQFHEVAQRSN